LVVAQVNALVTGTSRGLGRALAEGIAARGGFVVGVGRTEVPVVRDDRVMVRGDLTDERTVSDLCSALGDRPLDLLVHNAAVGGQSRELSQAAVAEIRRALEVDVLGPAALTAELLPALRRADHPLVLLIGSRMGDVTFNRALPPDVASASYAYRIAKAGVGMLSVALARELGDAATVLCIDPGPMVTAMGRPDAERDPVAVAAELLEALGDLRGLATGSAVALMDRRTR
jgi:NAD(P)-dependent dehydrogenase (short-subunit alcohol dehydrogenase family)